MPEETSSVRWAQQAPLVVAARIKVERLRAEFGYTSRDQVNGIRHHKSNYDDLLRAGPMLSFRAYTVYKTRLLRMIARCYPHLADECERQIAQIKTKRGNQ